MRRQSDVKKKTMLAWQREIPPNPISKGLPMICTPRKPSGMSPEPRSRLGVAPDSATSRTANLILRAALASFAFIKRVCADLSRSTAPRMSKARAPKERRSIFERSEVGISEKPVILGAMTCMRIIFTTAAKSDFGKQMNGYDR